MNTLFRKLGFNRIDSYIISKFLVSFFFVFLVIMAIAIVIDISEKMEDFLDDDFKATAFELVFEYYLPFIPYMGAILTPLLIFIAVIFFTSRMAYNTEIVAILSSGTSFNRFLRPYIITGLLLSGMMLYANHFLVPRANKVRQSFELAHIKNKKRYGDNIHLRLDESTFISLNRFKYQNNYGNTFALEHYIIKNEERVMDYKITAGKLSWLPDEERWQLNDYAKWSLDGINESYEKGKEMDIDLNLLPDDFEIDVFLKESYDYFEMKEFLKKEKKQGSGNLEEYTVEMHRRTSNSLAIVILTLIGVAVASRKVRGGMGLHLAMGVGISALYVIFLQFSSTFSIKGGLHPLIGTNIPNAFFLIVALVLIYRAPK
jgi:lipopolysaccharide export system permease protein